MADKFTQHILQGFLLLGLMSSMPRVYGVSVSCDDTSATMTFTEADFTALGIDGNDDLIIHGSVDDDQSEVSSDCVLSAAGDITVDLDACGAVASRVTDALKITWTARNAESATVKRDNYCLEVCCTYPDTIYVSDGPVDVTLSKESVAGVTSSGDITLTLVLSPSGTVVVPADITGTLTLTGVPSSFIPQVIDCTAYSEVPFSGTSYALITSGAATRAGDGVTIDTPGANPQEFSFDSFVWTNDEASDIYIYCSVYVCNTDADPNCTTNQFRRRRRRALPDSKILEVTSGPIHVLLK